MKICTDTWRIISAAYSQLLSRYDVMVCGDWKYLLLIELDFAMVLKYEHVSSINSDDRVDSNISFVNFEEDSN